MNSKSKILLVLLGITVAGGTLFFKNIGAWLDQSSEPIYSDLIVCLSYNPMRLDRAVTLLKKGYGRKVIATTEITYTNLLKQQLLPEQMVMLPSSGTNTYEEGLLLKAYLQKNNYSKILLVSDPYHLYRVRWTIEHLFRNSPYQFNYMASFSRKTNGFWWNNSDSRRAVLRELPSILYYWFGHGLLGLQKNPVWVGEFKRRYLDLLEQHF